MLHKFLHLKFKYSYDKYFEVRRLCDDWSPLFPNTETAGKETREAVNETLLCYQREGNPKWSQVTISEVLLLVTAPSGNPNSCLEFWQHKEPTPWELLLSVN